MFAGLLFYADCERKLHFNVNHPHTEIQRMTAFLQDKEEAFIKLLMANTLQGAEKESKLREQTLRTMLARCKELNDLFTKTYEDNVNGKLSDERYMMITKRYDEEQCTLKAKIAPNSLIIITTLSVSLTRRRLPPYPQA